MAIPLAGFAVGAVVALLVGLFGTVHDPTTSGTTTFGFPTLIDMKVALSLVIGVLAVLQVVGALWIYGRLGIRPHARLGTVHRISGALTLVLVIVVAYHCLWVLGLETGSYASGQPVAARTVVHGILGCAVVGALVVKVFAVRSKRAPGWFLPVAGGLLFALCSPPPPGGPRGWGRPPPAPGGGAWPRPAVQAYGGYGSSPPLARKPRCPSQESPGWKPEALRSFTDAPAARSACCTWPQF
jgi:hypothetical protein